MTTILILLSLLGLAYGVLALVQERRRGVALARSQATGHPAPTMAVLPAGRPVLTGSAVAFAVLLLVSLTLVRIDAQEVGVVVTPAGVQDEELLTGWHFIAPWNSVKIMDKTIWVYSLTQSSKEGARPTNDAIWCPTADGIKMGFDLSVNWRIDPHQASWIYANISGEQDVDGKYHWIEENIIRPAIKSVMPLTVSKFTPIQCYSEARSEIQAEVFGQLKRELAKNRIIIEQAQIREVYYNPQYEQAINQKKLEEQKVLTMVQVTRQKEEQLKQASIEKDIAIQQSEGEAQALKIKGQSLSSNPQIIRLEYINKWDGHLPTYMMGNGQNVIMDMTGNGGTK